MELLTTMIMNTYPDSVIKNISDIVYRVQNAEKCKKYMCKLGLNDCNFIVVENFDGIIFEGIANIFKIYNDHLPVLKFLVMRGSQVALLPNSFGKDELTNTSFQKVLNTLLAPSNESCHCSICLEIVKLGQGGKEMCNTCFKSICTDCFHEYFIKCESNPGWCPSCRHHMYFTNAVKPDDQNDVMNNDFIHDVLRTNYIEVIKHKTNPWFGYTEESRI
jgi:hypothetical protein